MVNMIMCSDERLFVYRKPVTVRIEFPPTRRLLFAQNLHLMLSKLHTVPRKSFILMNLISENAFLAQTQCAVVTDTQLSGAFSQLENGDRPHPEVNIWEEPVHQKYCEEGLKFDTVYFERTRAWVEAEADKRVAVAGNRAVGV